MEPRRASGGCPLSPVQNLLATVSFGMASQTTLFSLLRRGQQIGVMAVMRLGFRYGERLTISRGNVVLAQVFGVLKHEMDGCMALSSFLALREYFLPEAWIPDWLGIPFWPHESRAAVVIGGQDAVAVIGGQHGDLGMASQANHFSLLGKGLGIGVMAVVRLGFRYGEQLSMLRGYVVSARVFGVLKHEMDVSMALSMFLALGEYSFPEACIPFYSGKGGSIWHLGHYIHYILGLLAAIRLATIFMKQQELGVVAVIGGQDVAVAAIGGQDDHVIVNAH